MRPFHSTISLAEARAILDAAVRPVARTEPVTLDRAAGRVLAESVVAAADVPAFPRAMMDGYAVIASDTSGAARETPRVLDIAGTVFTGEIFPGAVGPGACVTIATGAPLPAGADAVVMVEETQAAGKERVAILAPVQSGQNVGRAGADIARGTTVLRPGDVLLPGRVGVLAALGRTQATVVARPRVGIVSTGNEVVAPGARLGPGQIYDINRSTLSAVTRDHGGEPIGLDIAADTLDGLEQALAGARGCDLIVFSGGSSVGDRDLVIDLLQARGAVAFHGIAIRPGKPTAFGHFGGTPVFGMPGNPTSCLTNAYVLLAPFLRRMAHLPPHAPRVVHGPLARRVTSGLGRHQFYTVRLVDGRVEPAFKASGDITSMAHADGYIEIAADVAAVEAGTGVDVLLF
jgi:molybdopterin molybdotransferase